jgi:hypothetical protein
MATSGIDLVGDAATWAMNLRRTDTGHNSRVRNDGHGLSTEHPIRTAFLGRRIVLNDAVESVLGTAHQGGVIICGTAAGGDNLLDFIANASLNSIVTSFMLEVGAYPVTFSPSSGGDTINGSTSALVLPANSTSICYATTAGWIMRTIGRGSAVLTTILTAQIGSVTATPGQDLYFVSDYLGGTYWAPNAAGVLSLLGASVASAAAITVSQLRAITPDAGGLYKVIDWPAPKGSLWAERDGELLPLGERVQAYKTAAQVAGAASLTEQVMAVFEVPAGVLVTDMGIAVDFGALKSGVADSMQWRVRIGTAADGLSPNAELVTTGKLATPAVDGYRFEWAVLSNTTVRRFLGQAINGMYDTATSGSLPSAITVPDLSATSVYISITCTKTAVGAETFWMNGARVEFTS